MMQPMMRIGLLFLASLSLTLPGCTRDDSKMAEKLDQVIKKQDEMIDLMKKGGGPPGRGANPRAQRPRPAPTEVYAVPIEGAPAVGPKDAKVTIVEAFEFACPHCASVSASIEQIRKDYPKDVRVVYRQFLIHPQTATLPAQAACAGFKQGKYEEMYKLLFEKGYNANRNFSQENIDKIAAEAGLDMAKYKADMAGDCPKMVREDMALMQKFGVGGTPAFFINGRFQSGGGPPERFKPLIEEELKKAEERIGKDGTTVANYYQKWVLEKGKKKLDAAM